MMNITSACRALDCFGKFSAIRLTMLRWYTGNGKSVPPRSTFARADPLPPVSPAPAIGAFNFDFAASGVTVANFASLFGLVFDVIGAALADTSGRSAARGP